MNGNTMERGRRIGYNGHQVDFRRFNQSSQVNALIGEWRATADERDYWKERAIKAEAMAERLFAQCRALSMTR